MALLDSWHSLNNFGGLKTKRFFLEQEDYLHNEAAQILGAIYPICYPHYCSDQYHLQSAACVLKKNVNFVDKLEYLHSHIKYRLAVIQRLKAMYFLEMQTKITCVFQVNFWQKTPGSLPYNLCDG